jgi:pimeloyl-ACP methyl ester carboxylesterase
MWKNAPRLPGLFRVQMRLFAWLARNFPNLYVRMILSEFSETDRREYARLKVADFLRPDRNEGYRQGGIGSWYDAMIPASWPIPLEEIKTKVLLWQGEEDISVPLAMGRYIAEKLPNCDAKFLPGVGHFWIFEHIGEMLNALVLPSRIYNLK